MKTIQINNKHYQECDVVMLPTDVSNRHNCTKGLIVKCIKSWAPIGENDIKENTLTISKNYSCGVLEHYQPQHLYILSNEETRSEECWHYNHIFNTISKETSTGYKKIIATTDTSLSFKNGEKHINQVPSKERLPRLPQQFIEHFINEYNKGSVINKVLVEVEETTFPNEEGIPNCFEGYNIKLNENNEISILTEEESFESAAVDYISEKAERAREYGLVYNAFKAGAEWQAKQNLK